MATVNCPHLLREKGGPWEPWGQTCACLLQAVTTERATPCHAMKPAWCDEVALGTVGAGEPGTLCICITQRCVKLEMSAIFFVCLLSKEALAQVQHLFSQESEVCTTSSLLHRPTLGVRGVREGMKVSRVLAVSGDRPCSAHLSLSRLPGAFPS